MSKYFLVRHSSTWPACQGLFVLLISPFGRRESSLLHTCCHSLCHLQTPTEQNFLCSTKHSLESKQISLYLISGKPWEVANVPSSCTKRCLNALVDCNSRKGDNPPSCCLEILLSWMWMQKLREVERTECRFLTS